LKEIAYLGVHTEYADYAGHMIFGRNLSHWCSINTFADVVDDNGEVTRHAQIERQGFYCSSRPPHMFTSLEYEEGSKRVQELIEDLTAEGFRVVERGPYWYQVRLERAMPLSSRYKVYLDINSEEYRELRACANRRATFRT
jgi:hypothetical protein